MSDLGVTVTVRTYKFKLVRTKKQVTGKVHSMDTNHTLTNNLTPVDDEHETSCRCDLGVFFFKLMFIVTDNVRVRRGER